MNNLSNTIENEPMTYQLEQFEFGQEIDIADYRVFLFLCCFDYTLGSIDIEALEADTEYNYREFEKLCIKNDCKEYAPFLYIHCRAFKAMSSDEIYEQPKKRQRENLTRQIEQTEALIPFFSAKNNSLKINISTSTEKGVLLDEKLVAIVRDSLLTTYKEKEYNKRNLTFEEAKNEIEAGVNSQWLDNYKNRWLVRQTLRYRAFEVDDALVEKYAEEHYKEEEVTLEHLVDRLGFLKGSMKGAPAINDKLAQLAEKISYLIRFENFLKDEKCDDIENFTMTNEHCRFIFSCLSFFELLDKNNAQTVPPDKTHNYIRTTIKQYQEKRKNKYYTGKLRFTELQLNHLKMNFGSKKPYTVEFCRFWDIKFINYQYWDFT